jgi:hypothetical protein
MENEEKRSTILQLLIERLEHEKVVGNKEDRQGIDIAIAAAEKLFIREEREFHRAFLEGRMEQKKKVFNIRKAEEWFAETFKKQNPL